MLETDNRVILSSAGCYSRSDGSWTGRPGKAPAIWFLEAACNSQRDRASKSADIAHLRPTYLRLTEDGGRISPVRHHQNTDQNCTNSSTCTKPASVKLCDLRIMLITRDEHGFFGPSAVPCCSLTAEPVTKHDSCDARTNAGLSGCHTR